MAQAQITLVSGHTLQFKNRTYKRDVPVPSTNPSEIAWAKTNGSFMVLDLEMERAALEESIAAQNKQLKALVEAEEGSGKGRGRGRTASGGV